MRKAGWWAGSGGREVLGMKAWGHFAPDTLRDEEAGMGAE